MRLIAALMAVHAAAALGAETDSVPQTGQCQIEATRWDAREVKCTVAAAQTARRFRFAATFSGSHDDTALSLTARLNDQPLLCEEGSKTDSEGEDGDVMLECRFSISEQPQEQRTLKFLLSFRHAEYGSFDFGSI